ncbi:MAG: tetratricopeptide repeat protein [Xanthobacteraceae bacterium]
MLDVRVPSKLRFRLLGQAALSAGDSDTIRISSQKGFALLAYLAMHPGRPVSRTVLADLLWSDRGEAQARQNLRQSILTLRRDLKTVHSVILQTDDQSAGLAVDATEVDALQFAAWAKHADPAIRMRCLEIPWGSFLHGFSVGSEAFDEWVIAERQRLDAIADRTFSELAAQSATAGDGERAILALERLIALDPGEEDRHLRLISLEARYRGRDAALARAKSLAAMLRRELDAEPEAATRKLVDDIRRAAAEQTKPEVAAIASPAAPAIEQPHSIAQADSPAPTPPLPAPVPRRSIRSGALAAGLVLLLAGGLFAMWQTGLPLSQRAGGDAPTVAGDRAAPTSENWQSPSLPSRGDYADPGGRSPVAIAVLPFTSFGPTASTTQHVADAITDDLINVLSRVPGLRVISRQTMRRYDGRSLDIGAIGSELGVRYVLEGTLRMHERKLRLNAELTDSATRTSVWSDRIDHDGDDWQHVLDEMVNRLGRQLQVTVARAEAGRLASDTNTAALVVKGWAAHHSAGTLGVASHKQAMQHFSKALERDRENVAAKAGLAAVLVSMAVQGTAQDREATLMKAEGLLREAREADPRSVAAHYYMGVVHRARGRKKEAIEAFERAIAINPSHASSYANMGFVLALMGRAADGLEHIRYAMRLSPKDPILSHWHYYAGRAELELERYDIAIEHFRQSQSLQPTYQSSYAGLAAAQALSGNLDAARATLAGLQKFAPQLSRDRLLARFGADRGERRSRMVEGMRLALGEPPSEQRPSADASWQSPALPSQRADDAVAPGRGLVAIAVLPFTSYDAPDNGRSIIAEMMTDDLTYLLSRTPAFRVISRQTMLSYRGQTIDAGKLGSELGIHYLLEGNASMRGTTLRVTVSLIDTRTRLHVWSGSFERAGENRDALQTEIVKTVGRELQYSVMAVEGARASSHPDVNELIFRGYGAIWDSRRYGVEGLRPAEKYFLQALERDPGALRATIGLAAFHVHMGLQLFVPDPKPHLAKAEELLRPILARHPSLTEAHAHMGLVHTARGESAEAIASFERVIALNPSHAPSYAQLGRMLVRIGRAEEGRTHIHYAMKLSPRDPIIGYWHAFAGYAELELGNYDKAIDYLGYAHAANPTQPRTLLTLISANVMAGHLDVAQRKLAELRAQHPHMTHARLQKMYLHRKSKLPGSKVAAGILRVLAAEAAGPSTSQH